MNRQFCSTRANTIKIKQCCVMLMIGGLTNKTATDRETDGDGRRKLVERGTVRGEDGEREREIKEGRN